MDESQLGLKSTPRGTLITTRIIWGALLAGQIGFLFVILVIWSQEDAAAVEHSEDVAQIVGYVAIAMLVVLTPIGYFIRSQVYKANWQGDVVKPLGYARGNIILLAMLEGTAFFGLIGTLIERSFSSLPFVVAVIAMAIQVINFPNGRPMFEQREVDTTYDRGER